MLHISEREGQRRPRTRPGRPRGRGGGGRGEGRDGRRAGVPSDGRRSEAHRPGEGRLLCLDAVVFVVVVEVIAAVGVIICNCIRFYGPHHHHHHHPITITITIIPPHHHHHQRLILPEGAAQEVPRLLQSIREACASGRGLREGTDSTYDVDCTYRSCVRYTSALTRTPRGSHLYHFLDTIGFIYSLLFSSSLSLSFSLPISPPFSPPSSPPSDLVPLRGATSPVFHLRRSAHCSQTHRCVDGST